MKAEKRLWRTAKGALVADGDARAAYLAYAAGDELSAADAALMAGKPPAEKKAAEKEPEKKAAPAAAAKRQGRRGQPADEGKRW